MDRRQMLTGAGAAMMTVPAKAAGSWDAAKLKQAAQAMDGWIADGRVAGASILVTQGSRRMALNYGTARGTDPIFLLASITKPMTAAVVMTTSAIAIAFL